MTLASADTGAVTLDDTDGDNTNGVQDTLTFTAGDWGTAHGGLALSEGGARFGFGPDFDLGLEGERRESRTERAEHGLMLRRRMRW